MLLQDWIAQYELKTKEKFKRDKRFELFSCQKKDSAKLGSSKIC